MTNDPDLEARLAAQRAEFQKVVDEANIALRELRERLATEQERRKYAEAELENLKKGSIAMMKYVTDLQRKKHDEEVAALKKRVRAAAPSPHDTSPGVPERGAALEELRALEAYLADQYSLLERARAGGSGAERAAAELRENWLRRREEDVELKEREVREAFQRMKEERQLRRAEAEGEFMADMGRIPEMQRLILERDETIKRLSRQLESAAGDLRRLKAKEEFVNRALTRVPGGAELEKRLREWDDEIVSLRHRLAERDNELEQVKRDFQMKLRNTIALQRIKREQDTEALKGHSGRKRRRLLAKRQER